jgi:hypothetical protein
MILKMIIIYIYNFIISLKIIFIFFDAKLKLVSSCTDTRVRSFRQEIPDLRRLPAIDDKKVRQHCQQFFWWWARTSLSSGGAPGQALRPQGKAASFRLQLPT